MTWKHEPPWHVTNHEPPWHEKHELPWHETNMNHHDHEKNYHDMTCFWKNQNRRTLQLRPSELQTFGIEPACKAQRRQEGRRKTIQTYNLEIIRLHASWSISGPGQFVHLKILCFIFQDWVAHLSLSTKLANSTWVTRSFFQVAV